MLFRSTVGANDRNTARNAHETIHKNLSTESDGMLDEGTPNG